MPRAALVFLAFLALAPAIAAAAATPAASIPGVSSPLAPATPAAETATAPGLRLSEVLFHPAAGEPGFVELLNAGPTEAPLDRLNLVNERDQTVALPDGLAPLAPGAVLLVVFDGGDRVEESVLHAPSDFLALDSSAVELRGADNTLFDIVAWGADQPDAVNLGRGGLSASPGELAPGTTIGRAPETTSLGPLVWTIFGPDEASPGSPNPQPGVSVLLPLPGTILDSPSANLRWYPVPGAMEYRVQLSPVDDTGFAAPLVDTTVPEPSLFTDPLSPGSYLWRVQAIGTSTLAAFSAAQSLEVESVSARASGALRAMPAAQAEQVNVLPVPFLAQHKDTKMLLIDRGVVETGAHAWDKAHPGSARNDPADRYNCVLAVAAMINAYSGGKLSQDRIGFEIRGGGGPEGDLNWNRGLQHDEVDRALAFALGLAPARIDVAALGPDERDFFWRIVVDEIDAGRPMAVLIPDHAVVIVGYADTGDGDRALLVSDPFGDESDVVPLDTFLFESYYLTPLQVNARSDEPGITKDSDSDGVVDFDETQRFGTDPANKDTDGDKLPDKQDILASVFDPKYGYATFSIGRPDFDGDHREMELDKDSDDGGGGTPGMGGCPDGMEDRNRDGKQNGAETSNFDAYDDRCFHATYTVETTMDMPLEGGSYEYRASAVLEVWAQDTGQGTLKGWGTFTTAGAGEGSQMCVPASAVGFLFQGQDLVATGTREGDHIEIDVSGQLSTAVDHSVTETCVGVGTISEEIEQSVPFTYQFVGDLVDGRFEEERTEQPYAGTTIVHHTLIEQKGQDDAGASVG